MNAITLVSGFFKQYLIPSAIISIVNKRNRNSEIRDFIEKYKMTVSDGLSHIFSTADIVMVGELHLPGIKLPSEVAKSLKKLKSEGLTTVALEIDRKLKDKLDGLDWSQPKEILKEKIREIVPLWTRADKEEILIEAKKLDLKVIYFDYDENKPKNYHLDNEYQNLRDYKMFEFLEEKISIPQEKVLIYCGSHHVHKEIVRDPHIGTLLRLAFHLTQKFGDNAVKSVRFLFKEMYFDGFQGSKPSTPKVKDTLPDLDELLFLPDSGPLKGSKVSTGTDYVVIDPLDHKTILKVRKKKEL